VVRADDSGIRLSGIEHSLLYLLPSRPGRVVTRERIRDAVWDTDFLAASNIIDRHAGSLRVKLQNGRNQRGPGSLTERPGPGVEMDRRPYIGS